MFHLQPLRIVFTMCACSCSNLFIECLFWCQYHLSISVIIFGYLIEHKNKYIYFLHLHLHTRSSCFSFVCVRLISFLLCTCTISNILILWPKWRSEISSITTINFHFIHLFYGSLHVVSGVVLKVMICTIIPYNDDTFCPKFSMIMNNNNGMLNTSHWNGK